MLPGLAMIGAFDQGGLGGSFEVSVSPTTLTRTSSTRGPGKTLITSPATVTATGGAGSYSYAWVRVSGDAAITPVSPTAASTGFTAALSADEVVSAAFVCTVTDGSGAVLTTAEVSVTMSLFLIDTGGTL